MLESEIRRGYLKKNRIHDHEGPLGEKVSPCSREIRRVSREKGGWRMAREEKNAMVDVKLKKGMRVQKNEKSILVETNTKKPSHHAGSKGKKGQQVGVCKESSERKKRGKGG